MPALLTTDPATLAIPAPDGTPVVADMDSGPPLTGVVAGGAVSFPGAVGRIVTRVMAGEGAYFDGDTPDTSTDDYAWTATPGASTSTDSQQLTTPGQVPPSTTWDDAACLGPPTDFGYWNTQPATLRWDQIDPAKTWNTYAEG